MSKFNWTPEISVGNEHIDSQHQALFNLMEQFYQATIKGGERQLIQSTLEKLKTYTKEHFEDEEKLMLDIGYPDAHSHKTKHDELIAEVNRLIEQYHRLNDVKTIDLLVVMFDWIANHIESSDLQFKPYVTKHHVKNKG
jgi:hemerythrin